jgi:hypothetical protein
MAGVLRRAMRLLRPPRHAAPSRKPFDVTEQTWGNLCPPKLLIRMTRTPRPVFAAVSTLEAWSQTCLSCAMVTGQPPGPFGAQRARRLARAAASGRRDSHRRPRSAAGMVRRCPGGRRRLRRSARAHPARRRRAGLCHYHRDLVRRPSPGPAPDSERARAGAPSKLDCTAVPTASGRLAGANQHQLAGYRSGDHLIRLHPGRARPSQRLGRRWRLGDRVKETHACQPGTIPGHLRLLPCARKELDSPAFRSLEISAGYRHWPVRLLACSNAVRLACADCRCCASL